MDIKEITKEDAIALVETGNRSGAYGYEPWGLYYQITTDRENNPLYVGYDNSDGNCWVEEFHSKEECLSWLRGDSYV